MGKMKLGGKLIGAFGLMGLMLLAGDRAVYRGCRADRSVE
jgi:hypothetical protein